MRENKYRGRRSYDKKWIYGSLLIDCDGDFHIVESKVVEKDGHHIQIDSDFPMFFDNETIGQFTGLHDKNGVEIYENDIIRVVALDNDHSQCGATSDLKVMECMGNFCLETGTTLYPFCLNHTIEVIGNIHESEDK